MSCSSVSIVTRLWPEDRGSIRCITLILSCAKILVVSVFFHGHISEMFQHPLFSLRNTTFLCLKKKKKFVNCKILTWVVAGVSVGCCIASRHSDISLDMVLSWSDQLINRHVVSGRLSDGFLFVLKMLRITKSSNSESNSAHLVSYNRHTFYKLQKELSAFFAVVIVVLDLERTDEWYLGSSPSGRDARRPQDRPFVLHVLLLNQKNPVLLPKFQMAPLLSFVISSRSKKKEPRYVCLSEAKALHSYKMWNEVSSSVRHFLQVGSLVGPITYKFLLKMLCPVSRPITTLDCVLVKDSKPALVARSGPEINSRACLCVLQGPLHITKCWLSIQHFIFLQMFCLETPNMAKF